jgi:DNA-binding HxlR family transcriptional regulator
VAKKALKARPARKAARPILHPGQIFCPVGRAMDVIGDRWTLVLVRHLLNGPCGFQELRVRTGIAPRVLSSKLRSLASHGLVEVARDQPRPLYRVTERGRALEPIIASIARWYLRNGLDDLQVDANRFSATSAQSVIESLPFMLREERAADADVTFEVRLSGLGGGVWTVRIANGACTVRQGFAEHADVRYTADARVWCGVALGIADARDTVQRGLMVKDGGRVAMDYYFYQINRAGKAGVAPSESPATNGASPPAKKTRARKDNRDDFVPTH